MKMTKILVAANLVLGVALAGQYWMRSNQTHTELMASWVHHAPDMDGAVTLSESIVTGRVLRIESTVIAAEGGDPRNPLEYPGEVIYFQAVDTDIRGNIRRGQRFEVFHLGNSEGDSGISVEGDPPYAVGEEYMLFLMAGPTVRVNGRPVETMVAISPEGRWGVDSQTRAVRPVSELEWVEEFDGMSSREFRGAAERSYRQAVRIERE